MLQRARQIKVVGRALVDRDADAGAVDVLDRLQRGILRHHVGALDQHIGRGEVDLGGAHRLDREEGDVPGAALQRIEHLAGGVEDHELERQAEALGQFPRQIGGDAQRLAVRPLLRQHGIALVDRRAQRAGRGKTLTDVGRSLSSRECLSCWNDRAGPYHSFFAAACALGLRHAVDYRCGDCESRVSVSMRVVSLLLCLVLAGCLATGDQPRRAAAARRPQRRPRAPRRLRRSPPARSRAASPARRLRRHPAAAPAAAPPPPPPAASREPVEVPRRPRDPGPHRLLDERRTPEGAARPRSAHRLRRQMRRRPDEDAPQALIGHRPLMRRARPATTQHRLLYDVAQCQARLGQRRFHAPIDEAAHDARIVRPVAHLLERHGLVRLDRSPAIDTRQPRRSVSLVRGVRRERRHATAIS